MIISDTEYDTHKDSERQLVFEWRRLEERLRKEEEQRLAEQEAERERRLYSAREEEQEKRRHRSQQIEEELRKTRAVDQVHLSVNDLREIAEYPNFPCGEKKNIQFDFLFAIYLQFEYLKSAEGGGEISQSLQLEMVKQQVR